MGNTEFTSATGSGRMLAKHRTANDLSRMLDGAAYVADPRLATLLTAAAIKLREFVRLHGDIAPPSRNKTPEAAANPGDWQT